MKCEMCQKRPATSYLGLFAFCGHCQRRKDKGKWIDSHMKEAMQRLRGLTRYVKGYKK